MQEFKRISILHISDLHKNDTDDFDNLYQSMVDDCDRYVKQGILKPNIIVVSGDLIRGGKPEEITSQYKEARAFLDNLTTYFLNGDKMENPLESDPPLVLIIDPPPSFISTKKLKQAEVTKNHSSLLCI